MAEPIEMTAIRNKAAQPDAGPGSGVQESRAIVAYVDKILLDLGNARRLLEVAKARDDVVRREAAEAKQIRASASNVAFNADQRVLVYWRDAFNARTFVRRLIDSVANLLEIKSHRPNNEDREIIEEASKVVDAARAWFDGAPPRDPNEPEHEKLETT